jgi:hypothetical protein
VDIPSAISSFSIGSHSHISSRIVGSRLHYLPLTLAGDHVLTDVDDTSPRLFRIGDFHHSCFLAGCLALGSCRRTLIVSQTTNFSTRLLRFGSPTTKTASSRSKTLAKSTKILSASSSYSSNGIGLRKLMSSKGGPGFELNRSIFSMECKSLLFWRALSDCNKTKKIWLGFLDAFRTFCAAPSSDTRAMFELLGSLA